MLLIFVTNDWLNGKEIWYDENNICRIQFLFIGVYFGFSMGMAPVLSYALTYFLAPAGVSCFTAKSSPVFSLAVSGMRIYGLVFLFSEINIYATVRMMAYGRDISLVWLHFYVHLHYCFYFWLCFLVYWVWQEYDSPFLQQKLWPYSFLYGFCDRFNHKKERLFHNHSLHLVKRIFTIHKYATATRNGTHKIREVTLFSAADNSFFDRPFSAKNVCIAYGIVFIVSPAFPVKLFNEKNLLNSKAKITFRFSQNKKLLMSIYRKWQMLFLIQSLYPYGCSNTIFCSETV